MGRLHRYQKQVTHLQEVLTIKNKDIKALHTEVSKLKEVRDDLIKKIEEKRNE